MLGNAFIWSLTRHTPWKNTRASSPPNDACSMASHDIDELLGEKAFLSVQYFTHVKKLRKADFEVCSLPACLSYGSSPKAAVSIWKSGPALGRCRMPYLVTPFWTERPARSHRSLAVNSPASTFAGSAAISLSVMPSLRSLSLLRKNMRTSESCGTPYRAPLSLTDCHRGTLQAP